MSKKDKLIKRIQQIPKDLTFDEVETLLTQLKYKKHNKGKTSGSRVMFIRVSDQRKIMLHKPHPSSILKKYAVEDLLNALKENGDL